MYCRFCGTKIPDNVKFCPECGADLAPASSPRFSRWISSWAFSALRLPYTRLSCRERWQSSAPRARWYYLIYIVSTAGTVLYLLIASIILGQSVFTAEVAGSIIGSLVMIFINIPYFNNRKHLFVNP